jgi:hypothetical protein
MAKFTVTMTPFDNFGGRSKVRFGVGEQIKVDVKEEPAVKPPTPLVWSVKSGPASVHNTKIPGAATVECGNKAGTVVLELHNTKDKSLVASKRFEVVAPTGVTFMHKTMNVNHGLGFKGMSLIEPADVSFKWVETREGAAPYEGKGCFAKAEVSLKELGDSYAVIHPVKGEWTRNLGGAKKNQEASVDTVMTAISNYGDGGEFVWNIPWLYRVHGVSGEFRFTTAVHKAAITKTGKMTLSKFNVSLSRQL